MNDEIPLSRLEIVQRVLSLIAEIKAMPDKVYDRWMDGRAVDLTVLAITQIEAMTEQDSRQFNIEKLRMQASAIPLTVAYMFGRKDAAQRFSRVLIAMRRYLGSFDPDDQPSRSKLFAVIGRALEVYGWPEPEPRDERHEDALQDALVELRNLRSKGGDDLDEILHDLR